MPPLRVLFVCTGNICRSPMAEGLARHHAARRGLDLDCGSAGLIARRGHPASANGVLVLAERGVDISGHGARRLDAELVSWADVVVAMEEEHRLAVGDFPVSALKEVHLLSEWAGEARLGPGIDDPIGGSRGDYEKTASEIEAYIERALDKLQGGSEQQGGDHAGEEG